MRWRIQRYSYKLTEAFISKFVLLKGASSVYECKLNRLSFAHINNTLTFTTVRTKEHLFFICQTRDKTSSEYLSLNFHRSENLDNGSFENKARYTATPVTCKWAEAVFEVTTAFVQQQWGQGQQKNKKVIVAKALDGQRYPCTALAGCAWSWRGNRSVAQKGSMTYAFTHMGNFLLLLLLLLCLPPPSNPSLKAQIPVSRPKSQSRGPNPSLEVQIQVLRPKS